MKKRYISGHQLFTLFALSSLGGSVTVASAPMAAVAKQDAWLGALVSAAYGMGVVLLFYFIGSRYPGLTLIGILRKILGKWLGTLLAVCYVFFFILLSTNLPWYIMDFMGHVMHETPQYAISLPLVLGFSIAVLYGIEVIARASEILIKFVTFIFFASILMVLPNIKPENMLPVFESGIGPILKSSVFLSCYVAFSMVSCLMVFPVNMENVGEAKKAMLKGFLWSNSVAFTAILASLLVLGSGVVSKAKYPTFLLLKEINLMDIFTRLEYFISVVWIITQFVVGALFFYSGAVGLSELLKLKDGNKIVPPLALIVFIMSGVVFPSDVLNMNWLRLGWTPFSITMGLILPLLLLAVHAGKKAVGLLLGK
jgi:spore germination protein KB